MEQFEDDPSKFIRLDLSLPGADMYAEVTTRGPTAADVLQAFMSSGVEAEATDIVGEHLINTLYLV